MLKGKMKAEILNQPTENGGVQWIGSAAYYDVYVNVINGVPFNYLTIYKHVVYEYDSDTGITTEIPQDFSDETITYVGINVQNNSELSTINRFVGNTITWIEPLTELTTPTTN